MLHRTQILGDYGLERVLSELDPRARWTGDALVIDAPAAGRHQLAGAGLLLLPSVFVWPGLAAVTDPPARPTLIYPARGIAELWQPAPNRSLQRARPPARPDPGRPARITRRTSLHPHPGPAARPGPQHRVRTPDRPAPRRADQPAAAPPHRPVPADPTRSGTSQRRPGARQAELIFLAGSWPTRCHGRESGWAVLVYPDSADAPASILRGRDGSSAASTWLADGAGRTAVPHRRGSIFRAEPDRAGGGYGKPGAARAEMLQMHLTHPLADLYRLLLAPQTTSTSRSSSSRDSWVPRSGGAATLGGRGQAVEHGDPNHLMRSSETRANPARIRLDAHAFTDAVQIYRPLFDADSGFKSKGRRESKAAAAVVGQAHERQR